MAQSVRFAHLSGPGKAFLEFRVNQYQFPDMGPDSGGWSDLNWLIVQFRVCDGDRQWSREDPAWETDDLPRLATWLRQTANAQAPPDLWSATEPLLTLVCHRVTPSVELTAELRLELQSDDAKMSHLDWDRPETIMLTPTTDELLDSADMLDEALRRLPRR